MTDAGTEAQPPKWKSWTGRVLSALPVVALAMSASMKLMHSPQVVDMFTGKLGYRESSLAPLGVVELVCAILYVVPRTALLGAALITGFLGGAVATHVRVGEPFIAPIVLGVLAWAGLYLRDPRLGALMPWRSAARG